MIWIFIVALGFFLIYWFAIRKPSKIKEVETIPVNPNLKPEYFEEPTTPTRVIWKLKDKDTQPSGNIECVAFSTQEMLESPPFNAVNVPTIQELFREISDYDKVSNENGLGVSGGMKYLEKHGFIKDYFNLTTRQQMIDFVKGYGTFQVAIPIYVNPRFRDGVWVGNNGQFANYHSVVVFGVDENLPCPAVEMQGEGLPEIPASVGAFRVRWHVDFFSDGFIEGWLSFALADELFSRELSFGYKI